jgi:hypothetical protein
LLQVTSSHDNSNSCMKFHTLILWYYGSLVFLYMIHKICMWCTKMYYTRVQGCISTVANCARVTTARCAVWCGRMFRLYLSHIVMWGISW